MSYGHNFQILVAIYILSMRNKVVSYQMLVQHVLLGLVHAVTRGFPSTYYIMLRY